MLEYMWGVGILKNTFQRNELQHNNSHNSLSDKYEVEV